MYKINNKEYEKEELKNMLLVTIEKRIDYAIEFTDLILEKTMLEERMVLYDILTALSLNNTKYATELIKAW